MMFFNKKKEENVQETFKRQLQELKTEVDMLKSECLGLAVAQNDIRNKVLRKIQFKKDKETEETEEKSEDLYNKVLLKEK